MSDAENESSNKSAKLLYRPIGMISSVVGGLIANALFAQIWRRTAPDGRTDPPNALDSGRSLTDILLATALQGAIFAVSKVVVDRAGARAFQRMTGDWPGD